VATEAGEIILLRDGGGTRQRLAADRLCEGCAEAFAKVSGHGTDP
jgi:hypothetical protein